MARPVLEIRDLCVGSGETAACRDVSFSVEAGQFLGILGGEGAGKSQLLRCIGLDFPPSSGSIVVQGIDVTGAPSERRRQLRARSIELVHPPAPAGERDLTVPGTRAGLLIPAGRAPRTAPVAGMRQRIQIAKALSQGADVLLLDEPFVGVEHGVRARIVELLERLRTETETAVVVASRDPEVARVLADEILVLDGDVIETGPASRVLDAPREQRTRALVQSRRSA